MAMTQKRAKVDDTSRDASPEEEEQPLVILPEEEISENVDLKENMNQMELKTPPIPQFWYSKTQLLEISQSPLSKKRPPCLDPAYNNAMGMWDPEKWFVGKRRAESPVIEEGKSKREKPPDLDRDSLFKRRPSDPKERLKDEQDNIILSPQRRSFGTGCHVSQQSSSRRPESPSEMRGIDREPHREPNRRIGSGRIISRDRDNRLEREFGFRNNERRERERFDRDDRELRYSNRNRDFPERKSRGRHQRIEEEEEPEWFSSGPTSQSETIELHGFEDSPEKEWDDKEDSDSKGKRWQRGNWRKTKPVIEENGIPEEDEKEDDVEDHKPVSRSPSVASQIVKTAPSILKDGAKPPNNETNVFVSLPQEFDVNKLFELDSIPSFLPNGTPPETGRGSRFSQWFRSESPVTMESAPNSRRSSQHDELVGNLINEINESSVMIPSPDTSSEPYFEPISPAQTSDSSKNILEMLHSAPVESYVKNENLKNSSMQELVTGQTPNVQEIEAELKQLVLGSRVGSGTNTTTNNTAVQNGPTSPACQSNEGDLSAFKKLLVQISKGQAHTTHQGMHFSPLDKSRMLHEKDIVQISNSQMMQPKGEVMSVPGRHSPVNFNNKNNLMRILQDAPTEQDILTGHNKRNSPPQQQPTCNQSGTSYPDFIMRILQQQPTQQPQSQPTLQSQRSTSQDNPLAKLLTSTSTSSSTKMRPCSPSMQDLITSQMKLQSSDRSDLASCTSGSMAHQVNRNQVIPQHLVNQFLQQQHQRQHQREILATIVKQQQQQQQQLQQAATAAVAGNQLQPQIIQPSVSSPNNLLQSGLNRSLSPRPTSPHAPDALQQTLFPPSQARIPSPLIFGQTPPLLPHAPSPIHPNQVPAAMAPIGATLNPNSLQVYNNPIIQRVPSPQELVLHTQQIMQNALIKCKLEEQKENYRKRQEMKRTRSPNIQTTKMSSDGSPSKGTNLSTTMAAFTPTSVMRKMQAEKDKDSAKMDGGSQISVNKNNDTKVSLQHQPLKNQSIGNGMIGSENDKIPRPLHGQGLMQNPVPTRGMSTLNLNQQGRAIVKGNQCLNSSLLTNKNSGMQNQKLNMGGTGTIPNAQNKTSSNMNNNLELNKILEQQRMLQNPQRQLNVPTMPTSSLPHTAYPIRGGGAIHPNIGRTGVNIPPNLLLRSMVHSNLNQAVLRAQLNQMALFQQHALDPHRLNLAHSAATLQHLLLDSTTQRSQPPSINLPNPTVGVSVSKTDTQPFGHLQSGNVGSSNLNNNFGMGSSLGAGGNSANSSTNRHSPINNLSKWFNSDVLKQKLSDLPPVPTQKALSLEEVEHQQQQTPVHN